MKVEKVSWSPYRLIHKSSLNAKDVDSFAQEGALFKIQFEGVGTGYSSMQTWESLGDIPLSEHLRRIKFSETSDLIEQSIQMAALDAQARKDKVNLLESVKELIPKSHFLISSLLSLKFLDVKEAVGNGFDSFKIKIGRSLEEEAERIEKINASFPQLKLRLDANASCDLEGFLKFWRSLSQAVRNQIEFVEDPIPFEEEGWLQLSEELPLALDIEIENWTADSKVPIKYLVLKPEAQNVFEMLEEIGDKFEHIAITSYMGHPIGQCWSAYQAAMIQKRYPEKLKAVGLLTHHLFEESFFDKEKMTPEFPMTKGYGWGFGERLKKTDWQDIYVG